MDLLPQIFINGIVAGSWFAAVGVGFVLLYRSTGIFNFAQGQLILVGAYLYVEFSKAFPMPLAFLASVLSAVLIGTVIHVILIQRMIGRDLFSIVILTLGLAIVIDGLAGYLWGPTPIPVNAPMQVERIRFWSASLTNVQLLGLALTATFFVILVLFLQRSDLGIRMRATAENPLLASLSGVRVTLVFVLAWSAAAVAGSIAGITFVQQQGITSLTIVELGLLAFPAIIVGGLDSIVGALIGGLVVGILDAFVITFWDPTAQFAVSYAILLAFLVFKPNGLFGSTSVQRI